MKIRVTFYGVDEIVAIDGVKVTPELTSAVDQEVKAAAKEHGWPGNWRLGWAVVYYTAPNPEVRRLLLAVLRYNEPGTEGVAFEEIAGKVVARFIRYGGQGLAERFVKPLQPPVLAVPAAPEVIAPVPTPVVPSVPAAAPAAEVPAPKPVRATRKPKPAAPDEAAPSGDASSGAAPEPAPEPAKAKSGRSVLKLKTVTEDPESDESKSDVETVRGGYVKWWK